MVENNYRFSRYLVKRTAGIWMGLVVLVVVLMGLVVLVLVEDYTHSSSFIGDRVVRGVVTTTVERGQRLTPCGSSACRNRSRNAGNHSLIGVRACVCG